jgi:hypothetical protein
MTGAALLVVHSMPLSGRGLAGFGSGGPLTNSKEQPDESTAHAQIATRAHIPLRPTRIVSQLYRRSFRA